MSDTDGFRYLEIASIHYDYIPSMLDSPKMFYVTLKYNPPRDLKIGSMVRINLRPNLKDNLVFIVEDISGYNVILSDRFRPYHFISPSILKGWGTDMRRLDVRPLRQDWHYGYGAYQSFLEYRPQY